MRSSRAFIADTSASRAEQAVSAVEKHLCWEPSFVPLVGATPRAASQFAADLATPAVTTCAPRPRPTPGSCANIGPSGSDTTCKNLREEPDPLEEPLAATVPLPKLGSRPRIMLGGMTRRDEPPWTPVGGEPSATVDTQADDIGGDAACPAAAGAGGGSTPPAMEWLALSGTSHLAPVLSSTSHCMSHWPPAPAGATRGEARRGTKAAVGVWDRGDSAHSTARMACRTSVGLTPADWRDWSVCWSRTNMLPSCRCW
mmetsp:Transcript_18826/g.44097  ORF Transcript_18826/g.44097 Transcript_18826/m.44097 type:complete len:256 (-) Transcript_18826:7045-7812(-)